MPLLPPARLRLARALVAALRGGCEVLARPAPAPRRLPPSAAQALLSAHSAPAPSPSARVGERGELEREPLLVFHFPAQQIPILQGPRARRLQLEDLVLEVVLARRRGPVGRQGGLKIGLLPLQDGAHHSEPPSSGVRAAASSTRAAETASWPAASSRRRSARSSSPSIAGHPLTQRHGPGFQPVGLGLHAVDTAHSGPPARCSAEVNRSSSSLRLWRRPASASSTSTLRRAERSRDSSASLHSLLDLQQGRAARPVPWPAPTPPWPPRSARPPPPVDAGAAERS